MSNKRKMESVDITAENVYDYFVSNNFIEKTCDDLYDEFQEKGSYKYLKNIGLHQISTATEWTSSPSEEVQKTARMYYDKIKQVTSTIEDEMDEIIKNKFEGVFRNNVKEEILKFINKADSLPNYNILEKLINGANMHLNVINVAEENKDIEEIKTDLKESSSGKEEIIIDDCSLDSLSSVHTSDLSSFDDEISISSDEETGRERRRVSLQFAQEEIERCKSNVLNTNDIPEIKKKMIPKCEIKKELEEVSPSGTTDLFEKPASRRVRKPNSKYFSKDVMSPFEIDLDKIERQSEATPRKRGRPRKYDLDL